MKTDLDRLLHAAGMNQSQLAKVLGIAPYTVTRWHGSPPQYARAYLQLRANFRAASVAIADVLR